MTKNPTYEELAQRVKALEQEKFDRKILETVPIRGEDRHTVKSGVISDPTVDSTDIDLGAIIDVDKIQSIMDDFFHLTHIVTAILDLRGNVIETTGWQDLCVKFHRIHPETARHCIDSDLLMAKRLKQGEYVEYKCKNGLRDAVTPLYVGSRHFGNIYTGQFFYDDDKVDEDFFAGQAERYGFDKTSYMEALRHIPRYSRETVDHLMHFLVKLATYISETGFANLQLEKEALRRRILIEQSRDGIVVLDRNGRAFEANKQFAGMLGYSLEEITRLHVWDWDTLLSREQLLDMIRTVDDSGDHFQTRHRRKDGSFIEVEISTNGLIWGEEKLIFCVCRDITDRTRTEEALRESEERFRVIATNTPDHVMIQDRDLRYVWVLNPQLGLSETDMIGKTDSDILPGKDAAYLTQIKQAVVETGNPKFVKVPMVSLTGDVRHLEGTYIPKRDHAGNIDGIIGYFRDVTNRVKGEDALRESEERFKRALENIPDVVVIYDTHLRIRYINGAATLLTGRPECDFTGKRDDEIWPPEIYMSYVPELRDSLGTGTVRSIETELPLRHGKLSHLKITYVPLLDKEGKVREILGITHDLTERNEAEAERLKLESKLRQTQKIESIGTLAGGIAHDFNNILASVIGFTELALDEVEKDTNLENSLQEVYAAGKRARDLVKQILTFARQSDEEIKPVQFSVIAKEVLKFIRSSIPSMIEIRQNIESDSLIMANSTQVHQILMNLCTNASHAMGDEGGIMELSLKDVVIDGGGAAELFGLKPGNYIEVKVSDTGVGIPPGIIDSIFDPYFTTKGPAEGTGMGLAMVHGIVDSYGGKITVHSTLGKGTVFTIYLPITGERMARLPYELEDLPKGTERILFVDDEAPIARIGGQILERLGYSVTTSTVSVEALELFRSRPYDFDLVVTDMTMPNMRGDTLAAELRQIRPDIPVIICSGYSRKMSKDLAAEIGIKAFAYKPVDKAELANTVRKVLDDAKSAAGA